MTLLAGLAGASLLLGLPIAAWLLVAALGARAKAKPRPTNATRLGFTLSAAYAGLVAIAGVVSVIAILVGPTVQLDVPVQEYWPTPPGVEYRGDAQRVAGGFYEANLTLEGLSLGARALWALSQGLGWLIPATVAATIAVTFVKLSKAEPFAPVLIELTMIAAFVIGIGGMIGAVTGDIAGSMAAAEALNGVAASGPALNADGTLVHVLPQPGFHVELPFWPIGATFGLGAISMILRRGQALEQDSKGLI